MMDLMEKISVFSEKLGKPMTVSVTSAGAMLCTEGAAASGTVSQMWMDGYWSDGGGNWDHNAWADRW